MRSRSASGRRCRRGVSTYTAIHVGVQPRRRCAGRRGPRARHAVPGPTATRRRSVTGHGVPMRVFVAVVGASARRRARRCGAARARAARSGCPCGRSCAPRCSACSGMYTLPSCEALEQLVGRQVDQLHLVGLVEDAVGHRLPDAHAGDLADDVVQALEVLHVDRGVDVDAGVEQLLDVLPALGVARARRVGVRELVDERSARGSPRERGVEVELLRARRRGRATSRRGRTSRPSSSASVSRRPCVSTTPTTTSTPSARCSRAACSIA